MERFLSKEVIILGSLPEDPVVRKAVREQVLLQFYIQMHLFQKRCKRIVNKFIHHQTEEVHVPSQTK